VYVGISCHFLFEDAGGVNGEILPSVESKWCKLVVEMSNLRDWCFWIDIEVIEREDVILGVFAELGPLVFGQRMEGMAYIEDILAWNFEVGNRSFI
jgi:hypothetical protein